MKLSKARLQQIIKEELQREGIFDLFKRKSKASSRWWLHPEMPTDVKQFTRGGTPREYKAMVKQTIDFLDALNPEAMFYNPYDYSWKKLQNVPRSLDRRTIPTAEDLRNAVPNPADPDRDRASWDIWSAEAREMLSMRDRGLSRKVYEYIASLGDYDRVAKQVQKYRDEIRTGRSKYGWRQLRAYYKMNQAEVEDIKKGIEKLINGEAPQEVVDAFKLAVLRGSWPFFAGAGKSTLKRTSMEDVYRTLLDLTDLKRSTDIDAELDTHTGYGYRPKSFDERY
jgi:hypothetical protein